MNAEMDIAVRDDINGKLADEVERLRARVTELERPASQCCPECERLTRQRETLQARISELRAAEMAANRALASVAGCLGVAATDLADNPTLALSALGRARLEEREACATMAEAIIHSPAIGPDNIPAAIRSRK